MSENCPTAQLVKNGCDMNAHHGTAIFTNGPQTLQRRISNYETVLLDISRLRKPTTSKWLWYENKMTFHRLFDRLGPKTYKQFELYLNLLQRRLFSCYAGTNAVVLIKAGCDSYVVIYDKPTLMTRPHSILISENV